MGPDQERNDPTLGLANGGSEDVNLVGDHGNSFHSGERGGTFLEGTFSWGDPSAQFRRLPKQRREPGPPLGGRVLAFQTKLKKSALDARGPAPDVRDDKGLRTRLVILDEQKL